MTSTETGARIATFGKDRYGRALFSPIRAGGR